MKSKRPSLIIAGGGLAGCLAALALSQRRADVDFLLVEQERNFGGNHVWSFFDTDIEAGNRALVDPLVAAGWSDHEVRFPKRERVIAIGYNSIRSANLDRMVREQLPGNGYRTGQRISEVTADAVLLESGERIEADGVIDARGVTAMPGLDLAWQKFLGRTYRSSAPHGIERPVIMDATVPQTDGYRFVYTLPFTETELMVEDTYYSSAPDIDANSLGAQVDAYANSRAPSGVQSVGEETGLLPVVLGGSAESLWLDTQPKVAKLGLRGGFFHPTTGYSLPDAVCNAALLADQADFSSAALHRLFENRALALWRERSFFRLLNRMLFLAAEPAQRYRVLEHFYRLPEPTIGRFYAAQLTTADKLRILSGRPPVPVGRALAAMRGKAA